MVRTNKPEQYPDIVLLVELLFAASASLTSFIVDSEIVAVDKKTSALRSFQELSNRARKDVQLQDVKVAVCVFAFDLMFLNGEVRLASREALLHLTDSAQGSHTGALSPTTRAAS